MATAIQPPCDESIGTDSRPAECASPKGTLVATVLGSSLAFVIGSIVNVALPQMQRTLATDAAGAQWIINAYLLPLSALVLLGGALGDHYGRRRIFLWGVAVMAAATLACAFAPTLELVLAARAVEGVGAALLAPTSLAIIAHAFKGKERGRAIGIWAGAGAVAGAAAPLIGGWLVDTLSWRWAFGVIVPPAAATWWIALRHVSESREEDDPAPLDWLGAGLTILALGGLVFALITFAEVGAATPQVLASAAVGTVAATAFFIVEYRKGERAMMPLAIFGTPAFAGISLLTLLLYAALGGLLVLLPYTLIAEEGYSATAAGAAILPFPLLMGLLSSRAGALAGAVGVKPLLIGGPLAVAAGLALMGFSYAEPLDYWTAVLPGLLLLALGMAFSVAPLTTAVVNSVGDELSGVASGVNNAIARAAGLIATALLGFVLVGEGGETRVEGFAAAALVGAALALASAAAILLLVREEVVAGEA